MTKTLRNIRDSYTFRLRKNPMTFVEGVASILDVDSIILDKYNTNETEELADSNALHSDWSAVGKDMRSALDIYGKQRN